MCATNGGVFTVHTKVPALTETLLFNYEEKGFSYFHTVITQCIKVSNYCIFVLNCIRIFWLFLTSFKGLRI